MPLLAAPPPQIEKVHTFDLRQVDLARAIPKQILESSPVFRAGPDHLVTLRIRLLENQRFDLESPIRIQWINTATGKTGLSQRASWRLAPPTPTKARAAISQSKPDYPEMQPPLRARDSLSFEMEANLVVAVYQYTLGNVQHRGEVSVGTVDASGELHHFK